MLEWFAEYDSTISAITSAGMLVVWITYLQAFLRGYRRQVLPKIVINRAAGSALDASCFISNMSSDAIYIESVLVTLEAGEHTFTCTVTDIDALDGDDPKPDPRERTHQGPLGSGAYTSIGTFDSLIERASRERDSEGLGEFPSSTDLISLEVVVIADYAAEDLPIGAKRRFRAEKLAEGWYLHPDRIETTQIRSRRERQEIARKIASATPEASAPRL